MYKWQSATTGEIVTTLWQVLRVMWVDLHKFHIANFKWQYNKNGF